MDSFHIQCKFLTHTDICAVYPLVVQTLFAYAVLYTITGVVPFNIYNIPGKLMSTMAFKLGTYCGDHDYRLFKQCRVLHPLSSMDISR